MKYLVGYLVLGFLLVYYAEAASSTKDKFNRAVNRCKKTTPVDEADIDKLRGREVPTSDTGKCFLACMMKEGKLLRNGKYLKENAIILAEIAQKNSPPEMVEKAKEVVELCVKLVPMIPDECEFAARMGQCTFENAKKSGLKTSGFE